MVHPPHVYLLLRILDRYDREVTSIAIFTDAYEKYQPDKYEYGCLGTSAIFRFKTYKIKGQDIKALENSDNPFAIVILTVLISLQQSEKSPEELLDLSLGLAKRLLRKGFSREKVNCLLDFLKSYVTLDDNEMFCNFEHELEVLTSKKNSMGIRELAAQLFEEKGMWKKQTIVVKNLLQKTNHSLLEIAELADTSIDSVIKIKNELESAAPVI